MTKAFGKLFILILAAVGLSSCVFDYPEDRGSADENAADGRVALHFNVNTLGAGETNTNAIKEKIRSLRIMVLNEESVECNQYIDLGVGRDVQDFIYDFRWWTEPGKKSLIVIANEESVTSISSELDPDIPSNLTELLDRYGEESEYENKADAQELMNMVNSIVFTPDYSLEGSDIFLPYTVTYQDIELNASPTDQGGPNNPIKVYLVPAATKFVFNFTNYRSKPININGISVAMINQKSYLLGHPSDDEYYKTFNNEKLYWVDWLARISKNSWNYPGFSENEGYNNDVGWIAEYYVPDTDDARIYNFIDKDTDSPLPIEAAGKETGDDGEEVIIPRKNSTPFYYVPESVNYRRFGEETDEEDDENEQRFYLTLLIEEVGAISQSPVFSNVAIPNLKALFRNTYVIINVEMSEGDLEVYAEIANWNEKKANGWVNEGNAPSPNPFSIRRK